MALAGDDGTGGEDVGVAVVEKGFVGKADARSEGCGDRLDAEDGVAESGGVAEIGPAQPTSPPPSTPTAGSSETLKMAPPSGLSSEASTLG